MSGPGIPLPTRRERAAGGRRSGMTLVVVLIVVALLALGGYTFAESMLSERLAAQAHGRRLQSRAAAESGVAAAMMFLSQDIATRQEAGGVYDNPAQFRARLVVDSEDASERLRFTILAPAIADGPEGAISGLRFGFEDESTRLNLNALLAAAGDTDLSNQVLMALPGMTEDVADAILDWLDADEESRPLGAESDYYGALDPPYAARNGPLDSLEELLMVRGVTARLMFGLDQDHNGIIDPNERAREGELGVDNANGVMDFGWAAYMTLHSAEANLNNGQPRVDVNQDDLATLHAELVAVINPQWADFIVAYRQNGPYTGTKASTSGSFTVDTSLPSKQQLATVLDLIGARVRIRGEGDKEDQVLDSPFSAIPGTMGVYLPELMNAITVNPAPVIPGRININQAPRVVLMGIPNISPETVEAILSSRQPEATSDQPARQHETWLLAEGIVELAEMKALMPFVTAGGSVHRATVVGYSDATGPATRLEIMLDSTLGIPRLLSWKDRSHLGIGYPRAVLGGEFDY